MTEPSPSNQAINLEDILQRFFQGLSLDNDSKAHAQLPPLEELKAELNRRRHWLEEMKRQSAEDFAKMKEDSARLDKELMESQKRMNYYDLVGFYRSENSTIRDENSLVCPMPLPNGEYPAEGMFPETYGDFLSLDMHALTALLELYELPHEDQVVDARKALAHHCCIPLQFPRSTRSSLYM